MAATATESTGHEVLSGLCPATVTAVEGTPPAVTCRVGDASHRATIAIASGYSPRVGDTVLVAPSRAGQWYVLGVLTALREVPVTSLAAHDGAHATLARDEGTEVLRVHDREGRALFEYRAGEGTCRVFTPEGDMQLHAPKGSIELVAAKGVNVRAPEVTVEGTRARVAVEDARLEAKIVTTVADRARHVVGVLESRATRIFEWARETYREAEEVAETRAAQVRTIATEALQMHARRALLKADEDVKLKGEQIHLA